MAFVPHFEPLAGLSDGSNTVFTASTAYVGNTFTLIVRGLPRLRDNDDGFAETDPSTGVVTLKEAPLEGDDVQGVWLEQVPDTVETEVTPLLGILEDIDTLSGRIADFLELTGQLSVTQGLYAELGAQLDVIGDLRSTQQVDGVLEICG